MPQLVRSWIRYNADTEQKFYKQTPMAAIKGINREEAIGSDVPVVRQLALDAIGPDSATPDVPPDAAQWKAELGQYWTPGHIADYMASLFAFPRDDAISLLDPGAGCGALTAAFVRATQRSEVLGPLSAVAYEVDPNVIPELERTLSPLGRSPAWHLRVVQGDFIDLGVGMVQSGGRPFSHVIMNPPYKKMNSQSHHRRQLAQVGIQTVNLYSAFMALAIELLSPGGQLVAIVPRSFCNGPYYRSLRTRLLAVTAIRHIHLFTARDQAFRDAAVLQENVIIRLDRDRPQGDVTISTSTDDRMTDYASHSYDFEHIVAPSDVERFIHIPTRPTQVGNGEYPGLSRTLDQLGIQVSTGPVVDFRLKVHLSADPAPGSAPLLYPLHLHGQTVTWPVANAKKPNAVAVNSETRKWLFPAGNYTVVKRFSSKEERRRIVATLVPLEALGETEWVGFENHLNVFHQNKRGLPLELCHGLAALLNSSPFDDLFRRFNGHTQVNATDLRSMKYPPLEVVLDLGRWMLASGSVAQDELDQRVLRAIA